MRISLNCVTSQASAAAATVVYFALAYLLILFFPDNSLVFYVTAPASMLVLAWVPILKPFGLVEGTFIVGPSAYACWGIVLLYGFFAYYGAALASNHKVKKLS